MNEKIKKIEKEVESSPQRKEIVLEDAKEHSGLKNIKNMPF